jgi:hypothetical protein
LDEDSVSKNDPPKNVPDPGSTIPGDFTIDQVLKGFEFSEDRIERARTALNSPYDRGRRWDSTLGRWVVDSAVSEVPDPSATIPGNVRIPKEIRDMHSRSPLEREPAVFGFDEKADNRGGGFRRDIQLGLFLGAGTAIMLGLVWFVLF